MNQFNLRAYEVIVILFQILNSSILCSLFHVLFISTTLLIIHLHTLMPPIRATVRPPNQVFKQPKARISECRGHAYPEAMRNMAVAARFNANGNMEDENYVTSMRQQGLYPSSWTVDKYVQRYMMYGHCRAFRRTGNHRARREVKGLNLYILSLHRCFLPKSTHAEANAVIRRVNMLLGNQEYANRFFSPSQLCRAEKGIKVTTKRGSKTANDAMKPENVQRRKDFWTLDYPYGIANISTEDMIDIDEADVYPHQTNRKTGKSAQGERVRETGTYTRDNKLNLLMAVSGGAQGHRWYELWEGEGTTNERFLDFIERILNDIGPGTEQRRFCFTMDNLTAHVNPMVYQAIDAAGHMIVLRAPYYPVDGPIEYVFNIIQNLLCVLYMREINDMETLRVKMQQVIASFTDFRAYSRYVVDHAPLYS